MTLSHQIRAICWRNLVLKKRGWFSSTIDLSIPFLGLCIIFYLYFNGYIGKENRKVPEKSYPRLEFKDDCIHKTEAELHVLYNRKNDSKVKQLIEFIKRPNAGGTLQLHGFDYEKDIENWVLKNVEIYEFQKEIYAIVFNDIDESQFSYKLRTYFPDNDPKSFRTWDRLGSDFYADHCLLSLQKGLAEGFLKVHNKAIPSNINLGYQMFPIPEHMIPGLLWEILQIVLVLFMMMSVMITTNIPIPKIVSEKQTGAKELMRLMGIRREVLWGGWLLNMLTFGLINVTYTTLLLKLQIKSNFSALLPNSNIILLWIVFALFLVSMAFYVLFFCSLFKKPLMATFLVILLILVPFFAISPMMLRYDRGKLLNILICMILPQFNWNRSVRLIVAFEKHYDGINFFNLFKPGDEVDVNIALIWLLLSYVLCCLLYSVLIWYFDNVFPGKYGIAKPFYFPFQMLYKKRNNVTNEEIELNETFFEKMPPNTVVGLSIRNLKKTFKKHVFAVNGVNIDVYDGQITALLGHNGAGKTTLMSIISGMYSPSSGKIYASDDDSDTYNVLDEMDRFRKSLGLCPQHNLVIPYLTVMEHLVFFGMLKGLTKRQAKIDGSEWLYRFNIVTKKNKFPSQLSGGMMRKLCLAISLIGNPKILILDEPTSGLDPESRRELWDSLLELRRDHTIIITTHYMEEADALGDRIAIMDHGKIICCGSPMFLKKLYGTGYNLQLLIDPNANINNITRLIKNVIPVAALTTRNQGQLTYSLPIEESNNFSTLFQKLEQNKNSLGITSIGISLTTMEEVFLRAGADTSQLVQNEGSSLPRNNSSTESENEASTICQSVYNELLDRCFGYTFPSGEFTVPSRKDLSGPQLIKQHFILVFKKKMICYYRTIFSNLIYLIITLACFCVVGWTVNGTEMKMYSSKTINFDLNDIYSDTKVVITYNGTGKTNADLYNSLVPQGMEKIYKEGVDINQILLDEGRKNVEAYKTSYVVGASWGPTKATALFSPFSNHGSAISVHLLLNVIIRSTGLNTKVTASYQSLPMAQSEANSVCSVLRMIFVIVVFSLFIPFGVLYFLGNLALFPLKERIKDAKQLQLMTGLSPITYWLAILLWDLLMYAILICLAVGVMAAFDYQIGLMTNSTSLQVFIVLLVLFGFSGIAYTYFSTFLLKSSAGVSRFVLFNIYIAVGLNIISIIVTQLPHSDEFFYMIITFIYYLIPPCCLASAMKKFSFISYNHLICLHCTPICEDTLDYFDWDEAVYSQKHLFVETFFLVVSFFLYVILIGLTERHVWEKIYEHVIGQIYKAPMIEDGDDEDDVKAERNRVVAGRTANASTRIDRVMVVDGLKKRFRRFEAVKGVSFQMPVGECFGLLGVNGAGKTTTFKMLTGALLPTAGTASITDYSLDKHRSKYLSQIGYCPQFDGINGLLTARETLVMMGQLRGMSKQGAEKQAGYWIDLLGLTEYADRQCRYYSGGNKRKLSVGMALMADPLLLFLDEPTSGVDPVARRKLWVVLAEIQKAGQSIILTSHSMDECETLCNRLTIMVRGKMKCIGNIQYLKQRFAQGFTAILKIQQIDQSRQGIMALEQLKQDFSRTFGDCEIISETIGTLQFHIKSTDIPWSELFQSMNDLKNRFDIIEDYTIRETTLEQVFIAFAREDRR